MVYVIYRNVIPVACCLTKEAAIVTTKHLVARDGRSYVARPVSSEQALKIRSNAPVFFLCFDTDGETVGTYCRQCFSKLKPKCAEYLMLSRVLLRRRGKDVQCDNCKWTFYVQNRSS